MEAINPSEIVIKGDFVRFHAGSLIMGIDWVLVAWLGIVISLMILGGIALKGSE